MTNPYLLFMWLSEKQGAAWRNESNVATIALPLGMLVAALVALVRDSTFFILVFLVGKYRLSGEGFYFDVRTSNPLCWSMVAE